MEFDLREAKIQRIGYSFYSSVPIEWIRHHRLHKGSTIIATLDDKGRLILEPKLEEAVVE